mmetsp:Transcript_102680/g.314071  ORF Transcript_102680/g.314071 Transcript_102680/m.314071 type:complete len:220 (-) Transcript_102680:116-775(-)
MVWSTSNSSKQMEHVWSSAVFRSPKEIAWVFLSNDPLGAALFVRSRPRRRATRSSCAKPNMLMYMNSVRAKLKDAYTLTAVYNDGATSWQAGSGGSGIVALPSLCPSMATQCNPVQFHARVNAMMDTLYAHTRSGMGCGSAGSLDHRQITLCTQEPVGVGRFTVELKNTMQKTTRTHIWSGTSHATDMCSRFAMISQISRQTIAGVATHTIKLKKRIHR